MPSRRSVRRPAVSRPQDAEDVTQETLLRLYRSAETLNDEQALEAWMYRIARKAITDHYRRSAVRPEPMAPDDAAAVRERTQPSTPHAAGSASARSRPAVVGALAERLQERPEQIGERLPY